MLLIDFLDKQEKQFKLTVWYSPDMLNKFNDISKFVKVVYWEMWEPGAKTILYNC
jgi:hypothetical protein